MRCAPLAAACGISLLMCVPALAEGTKSCHIGSYRLADGEPIDIAPSDGDTLRWRMFSGETGQLHPNKDGTWTSTMGWTGRPDGRTVSFTDCMKGDIAFGRDSGHKIAFDVSDTIFESSGTKLVGR